MMARIQAIYRYPVKGLSAEPLPRTALTTGATVPGDRLYAIENGPSGFDPATPSYLAKHVRCAATNVDPRGIYAEVVTGGDIAQHDAVEIL
jgi:uncharacterized protein YcbX